MSCVNDLARCDATYVALKQQLKDSEHKLEASQAREKVLIYAVGKWLNESHDRLYEVFVENKQGDDIALKAALAAEREKMLLDELAISQARERKLRSDARLVQNAENATQREHAFGMLVEHLGVWDESYLCAALAAEREKCIDACMRGDYEYKTARECVEAIRALGDE